MGSHYDEMSAWAKTLSDEQLTFALYELRERGHAVAAYDAGEAAELFDGVPDDDSWFDRDGIEETMCDAARDAMRRAIADHVPDDEDDEETASEGVDA